jgi:aspartate/tyrosine/aromatic aminotransferase
MNSCIVDLVGGSKSLLNAGKLKLIFRNSKRICLSSKIWYNKSCFSRASYKITKYYTLYDSKKNDWCSIILRMQCILDYKYLEF